MRYGAGTEREHFSPADFFLGACAAYDTIRTWVCLRWEVRIYTFGGIELRGLEFWGVGGVRCLG